MNAAFLGISTIILGVGGCVGYFYLANLLLDKIVFPPRHFDAEDSRRRFRSGVFALVIAPLLGIGFLYFALTWVKVGGGFILDGWFTFHADAGDVFVGQLANFWLGIAGIATGFAIVAAALVLGIGGFALIVLGLVLAIALLRIILATISNADPFNWFVFFGALGVCLLAAILYGFGVQSAFLGVIIGIAAIAALWALLKSIGAQGQLLPASRPGDNINNATALRPWLFLLPAILALGLYLAYPVYETLRLSLTERLPGGGSEFVGLMNYGQMISEPKFWEAMRNNMLWLIVVPAMSTAFGLLAAQLTDRISWGNFAKSLIFMPMAISFVGAAVIWKLVYDTRPIDQEQIGVLNAIYLALGGSEPQTWLTIPLWNNFFLMAVLVWIQTGFAMVILSAALRGIPEETVEAAIIDGASPFQIFFKIKVPQIMGTILVVWTTITIVVLKVFDIVFAMTNGQWETQVLANYMYDKLFRSNDWGVGSASAMVIMLLVTPILVWNVYNARKEMR